MNLKIILFFIVLSLSCHCLSSSVSPENIIGTLIKTILGVLTFFNQNFEYSKREFPDTEVKDNSLYDFIIVGAGAAGCVLANRLSENKNVKVLLIEAGGPEALYNDIPILAPYNQFMPITNRLETESSDKYCLGLNKNRCQYPQGRVMGGTTVINAMIATRGNANDYNRWASFGNDGWAYRDVLKYFKKLENFYNDGSGREDVWYRGKSGPLNISFPRYHSTVAKAFVRAGQEMGFPSIDYNGRSQIGFSILQSTTAKGERVSANRAYIHPIRNRKNLVVTKNSLVTKVLIDSRTKTAYGVTFRKKSQQYTVRARLETIVSAGAIRSPQLLMLSGLGPADHLAKFGIPLMKHIPMMGKNFQDHITYFGAIYLIDDPTQPHSALAIVKPGDTTISDYLNKRQGIGTVPYGVEAISFMNLNNQSARDGPVTTEFAFVDASIMFAEPLFNQAVGVRPEVYQKMFSKYLGRSAYSLLPVLLKPKSRGEILLNGNDINNPPRIIPNYFSHPDDVKMMTRTLRKANEFAKTQAMQKFKAHLLPELVYGCERFRFDSDEYWNCAMRTLPFTFWHFVGTCKMGPYWDKDAVVSPRLKVYGINRLRVVDASIMPEVPSAHTYLPTLMVAEKAADMIKEDYNLFSNPFGV